MYITRPESLIITQKVVPIYPSGVYRRLLAGADVAKLGRRCFSGINLPAPGRKTVADCGSLVGQGRQSSSPPSPSSALKSSLKMALMAWAQIHHRRALRATGQCHRGLTLLLHLESALDEPAKRRWTNRSPTSFQRSYGTFMWYAPTAYRSFRCASPQIRWMRRRAPSFHRRAAARSRCLNAPSTRVAGRAGAPASAPAPGTPGSLSTSSVIIDTSPTEAVAVSLNEGSRRSSYVYAPGASVPITLTSNPYDGTWPPRCTAASSTWAASPIISTDALRSPRERRRKFYHSICQSHTAARPNS